MKDKGDSCFPSRLDGHVIDALLGGAVVPKRQVGVTVRVLGRRLHLKFIKKIIFWGVN
jgi:hypothetical protein